MFHRFIRPMASITTPCSPIATQADRTHACSAAGCSLCPNNSAGMAHTGTPCVSHWLDRPRPHAARLPQTNNAGPAAAVISAGIAACPRVSSRAAKKSPAPAGNTRSSHAPAAVSTSVSVVASGIVIAGSFPNRAAIRRGRRMLRVPGKNPFRAAACRRSNIHPREWSGRGTD